MGTVSEQRIWQTEYQMPNKHMKKFSILLVTKETQIKLYRNITTHILEWLKRNCLAISSVGEDVEKLALSHRTGGKVVQTLWKTGSTIC